MSRSRHFTLLFFILCSILLLQGEASSNKTNTKEVAKGGKKAKTPSNPDISGLEEDVDDPKDTVVHERQELLATQPLCGIGIKCRRKREAKDEKKQGNPPSGDLHKMKVYKKATENLYELLKIKKHEQKNRELLHKVEAYAKKHPNPKYRKVVAKIIQDMKKEKRDEKDVIKDLKKLKRILKELRRSMSNLPPLLAEKTTPVVNTTQPPHKVKDLSLTAKTISQLLGAIAKLLDATSRNPQNLPYPPPMMIPNYLVNPQGQYLPNSLQYQMPVNPQMMNNPFLGGMQYPNPSNPQMPTYNSNPGLPMAWPGISPQTSSYSSPTGNDYVGLLISMNKGPMSVRAVVSRLRKIIKLLRKQTIKSYNTALKLLAMETYHLKSVTPDSLKWEIYLVIKLILNYKLSRAESMLRNFPNGIPDEAAGMNTGVGNNMKQDTTNEGYADWGPWSACSAECGVGTQIRRRLCLLVNNCPDGKTLEQRPCESKACP